ncbi:MAG: hypothetical protein ABI042_10885 [Verrucomicrobiota bacterium]
MKLALFAHLSSLPHLHRTDLALIIGLLAVGAAIYFSMRAER